MSVPRKPATMTRKVARSVPELRPQPHGGALAVGGVPGNKGGPGRPRDEFKELMRGLASSDEAIATLRELIADPSSPHHMRAREYATERGYGKEAQAVDATIRDVSYIAEVPATEPDAETWAANARRDAGRNWGRNGND